MDNDEKPEITKGDTEQNQESIISWPCIGVPSFIEVDTGRPFVLPKYKPNGRPDHKGSIELFFQSYMTFLRQLSRLDDET